MARMSPTEQKGRRARKWIAGAVQHPGSFTRQAEAAGESVSQFASEHAGDSGVTGKRARLAQTFEKMARRRKK